MRLLAGRDASRWTSLTTPKLARRVPVAGAPARVARTGTSQVKVAQMRGGRHGCAISAQVRYPSLCRLVRRRKAGCPSGQRERSVKPSASPTLVRIQDLPRTQKTRSALVWVPGLRLFGGAVRRPLPKRLWASFGQVSGLQALGVPDLRRSRSQGVPSGAAPAAPDGVHDEAEHQRTGVTAVLVPPGHRWRPR